MRYKLFFLFIFSLLLYQGITYLPKAFAIGAPPASRAKIWCILGIICPPASVSSSSSRVQLIASLGPYCLLKDSNVSCFGGSGAPNMIPTGGLLSGNVQLIGAGTMADHICAYLTDNTLRCWGNNLYGQLGNGSQGNSTSVPQTVSGITNVVSISADDWHTCVALSGGTVKCWGDNRYGELGYFTTDEHDPNPTQSLTPVTTKNITTATAVTSGSGYTCGLLKDGTVSCWGMGGFWLGYNSGYANNANPKSVPGVANAKAISAGWAHTCALLQNGTVSCWGFNGSGQLGDGTKSSRYAPQVISNLGTSGNPVIAISAGYKQTCAVLQDGTAKCWGENGSGQLGDGTRTTSTVPVPVVNINNAIDVAAGQFSTCFLLRDYSYRCTPFPSVSGNVFIDSNGNNKKDAGEANYSGSITITSTGGIISYPSAGSYTVSGLASGTYTIAYTSLPSGYTMNYPKNGPPPSFTVSISSSCSPDTTTGASCDANGNIINLNFAITNLVPWIQTAALDARFDNGITNKIPSSSSCTPYASVPGSSGSPGIFFSGDGSADFGSGKPSSTNWTVGGLTYPETYRPSPSVIKTSFTRLNSLAKQSGTTPVDLDTSGYCPRLNCTLPTNLPNGIYIANGNMVLNGFNIPVGANKNYIFLIKGDLTINGTVTIPNGSTALFSTAGNITVTPAVGINPPSCGGASQLEGFFSADKNFIINGLNDCSRGADNQLVIGGSIIVNAALNGGNFTNQRNLCSNNTYPSVLIKERPDFILNAPAFLDHLNYTYQEVAP